MRFNKAISNIMNIKPCPFCGGKASIKSGPNGQVLYIDADHKDDCFIEPGIISITNSDRRIRGAIKNWNKRLKRKTDSYLKPCPFCGEEAFIKKCSVGMTSLYVTCNHKRGCPQPSTYLIALTYDDIRIHIDIWNSRKDK